MIRETAGNVDSDITTTSPMTVENEDFVGVWCRGQESGRASSDWTLITVLVKEGGGAGHTRDTHGHKDHIDEPYITVPVHESREDTKSYCRIGEQMIFTLRGSCRISGSQFHRCGGAEIAGRPGVKELCVKGMWATARLLNESQGPGAHGSRLSWHGGCV